MNHSCDYSVYLIKKKKKKKESLRAGPQVFALLMLFLCVILYTMWSGKSLQLLCILSVGMLCLSAISMMFVKHYVGSVYVGGYGGLSKSGLCVFHEMCPVGFLLVDESPSVLLWSSGMLIVMMMVKWSDDNVC